VDGDPLFAEIAIMKKLQHPNIVRLHEVISSTENGYMYLVMEYCIGGPMVEMNVNKLAKPVSIATTRDMIIHVIRG
jgi:serine/threonine protein kinase